MTPTAVGAWLLLFGGFGAFVGSAWRILVGGGSPATVRLLVVGFAAAGVGAYGPTFLDPFTRFTGVLKDLADKPGPDSYRDASEAVASGKMPKQYQELVLGYMLGNPIPGLDEILEKATRGAKKPESAEALERARKELGGRKATAERIANMIATKAIQPEELDKLDSGTRALVAEPLLALKDEQLKALNLDRTKLRGLEAPRSVFVTRKASP